MKISCKKRKITNSRTFNWLLLKNYQFLIKIHQKLSKLSIFHQSLYQTGSILSKFIEIIDFPSKSIRSWPILMYKPVWSTSLFKIYRTGSILSKFIEIIDFPPKSIRSGPTRMCTQVWSDPPKKVIN